MRFLILIAILCLSCTSVRVDQKNESLSGGRHELSDLVSNNNFTKYIRKKYWPSSFKDGSTIEMFIHKEGVIVIMKENINSKSGLYYITNPEWFSIPYPKETNEYKFQVVYPGIYSVTVNKL
jgi:hypothetical protein